MRPESIDLLELVTVVAIMGKERLLIVTGRALGLFARRPNSNW
jgi:hypothetical protein